MRRCQSPLASALQTGFETYQMPRFEHFGRQDAKRPITLRLSLFGAKENHGYEFFQADRATGWPPSLSPEDGRHIVLRNDKAEIGNFR